uniref:Uncharacterized protein n=1 Tax=Anopheles dirus TaxID=7168 RepID=A0A182NWU7_9DIPT
MLQLSKLPLSSNANRQDLSTFHCLKCHPQPFRFLHKF